MKAPTSFIKMSSGSSPCIRGNNGRAVLLLALRFAAAFAMACGILLVMLSQSACATQKPPVPVVVSVCPPIPVPTRPLAMWSKADIAAWNQQHPDQPLRPFQVTLPAKDAAGNYCLSQEQTNDLGTGIHELQTYAAQMEAAVTVFNQSLKQQGH